MNEKIINTILNGDCREELKKLPNNYVSACLTDPPYNYEFIGHKWDDNEIKRRMERVKDTKTLVKNIPYGSGLAGGVRNELWYKKIETISLSTNSGVLNGQPNCSEYANRAQIFLYSIVLERLHMSKLHWKRQVFMREI